MEIHFLASSGGQKPEIHMQQGWFPPRPLSLASRQLSQLRVLTWTIDIQVEELSLWFITRFPRILLLYVNINLKRHTFVVFFIDKPRAIG